MKTEKQYFDQCVIKVDKQYAEEAFLLDKLVKEECHIAFQSSQDLKASYEQAKLAIEAKGEQEDMPQPIHIIPFKYYPPPADKIGYENAFKKSLGYTKLRSSRTSIKDSIEASIQLAYYDEPIPFPQVGYIQKPTSPLSHNSINVDWDYNSDPTYESLLMLVKSYCVRHISESSHDASVIGSEDVINELITCCKNKGLDIFGASSTISTNEELGSDLILRAFVEIKGNTFSSDFDVYQLDSLEDELVVLFGNFTTVIKVLNMPKPEGDA